MPVSNNTYASLLYCTTESYLSDMDMEHNPGPEVMEFELVTATNDAIRAYNNGAPDDDGNFPDKKKGDERYKFIKTLHPVQVAMCIVKVDGAIRIAMDGLNSDPDYDVIGYYAATGSDEGTYVTSEDSLKRRARRYNPLLSQKDFSEVVSALRDLTERRGRCTDRDLIPVNNGIFDYKNKMLLPFDPEYVFTSKCHVNFMLNATNPHIVMPDGIEWDVESWMHTLSDSDGVVKLLWQICGATIRPNVSWNKVVFLYSESGNNGKGTLCVLYRNLNGSYATIAIKDFSKDFMLEPLIRSSAIIVDENDVGTYIDSASGFKAVVTGDVISVNRKFKTPVHFSFHGLSVQCMNEFPKVKDRTDSFYRRILPVPMNKRFEGHERKYIKDDYLNRDDVLQYVLWKVLMGMDDYYEFDIPDECETTLNEFKEYNDSILQFMKEVLHELRWNFLTKDFIYALYKGWSKRNNPSGTMFKKNEFLHDFELRLSQFTYEGEPLWTRSENPVTLTAKMVGFPEPLICEYGLEEWTQYGYTVDGAVTPTLVGLRKRGYLRNPNVPCANDDANLLACQTPQGPLTYDPKEHAEIEKAEGDNYESDYCKD